MVAFTYRMGAGFAGDVNRSHPASIEPGLNDTTNPVQFYGEAVMITRTASNSYRGMIAGDTGVTILDGVACRPFPISPASGFSLVTTAFGVTVPLSGEIDVLKYGYIMVPVVVGVTPLVKGGPVYVWIAASGAGHTQGGFESTTSGSTITIANAAFNGPADANGVTELNLFPR